MQICWTFLNCNIFNSSAKIC